MPSPLTSLTVKALILAFLAVGLTGVAAFSQETELSPEQVEFIRQNAQPMPFPDISHGMITGDPVEFVFRYDLEDRPLPAEWATGEEVRPVKATASKDSKAATQITETEQYPYSSIVHIYMKFGEYYAGCSGAFAINNYSILTAGHCLYNTDTNSFAEEVYVIPGQDNEETPFGAKSAYNWATSRAWSNWGDYSQDWGVILIEPFAGNPGTLDTYIDSSDDWYFANQLDTAGYPGAEGYNGNEMWWDRAFIDEMNWGMLRPDFHFGTGDYVCIPGQSGSAIYHDDGAGTYSIVAVLTLASCHGPVLTQSMVDFLNTFNCTGCWIDNECHDDGAVHATNPCKRCDKEQNRQDWSSNDGATCDDGLWCNGSDSCGDSSCSEHEGDPCGADETCDEEQDSCLDAGDDDDVEDDDSPSYCQEVLELTYDSCGLAIFVDGEALEPQEALDSCEVGQGPWDCIYECAEHEDVKNCSDFSACLDQKCGVNTTSGSGGDDDDDDGGNCGS